MNKSTTSDDPICLLRVISIDRIEHHSVLLQINHKNYNFREKKNNQLMKEREISIKIPTKEA